MKALKKKWENSQQAILLKKDEETQKIIKKPQLNKYMENSTISFE